MWFGLLGDNQRLHLLCYVQRHVIAFPVSPTSIFQRLISTWPCGDVCLCRCFLCVFIHLSNRMFSSFCVSLLSPNTFQLVSPLGVVYWMQYYWFSLVSKSWKIKPATRGPSFKQWILLWWGTTCLHHCRIRKLITLVLKQRRWQWGLWRGSEDWGLCSLYLCSTLWCLCSSIKVEEYLYIYI